MSHTDDLLRKSGESSASPKGADEYPEDAFLDETPMIEPSEKEQEVV